MRKLGLMSLVCGTALALVAAAAYAGVGNGQPSPGQLAKNTCGTLSSAIGPKAFNGLYGKDGTQATCVRKNLPQANSVIRNAAQACRAERDDATFADSHGGATFDQVYGTNHNQKNSFGKCVSAKAKAQQAANAANIQNAAQLCRAERGDAGFAATHDGKSFTDFYGTNKNKKNAFGKCVSGKAKALSATPPASS